jgi:branched-subunit amino acid transport protein AzlD
MAFIILFTRVLPFLFFRNKRPPEIVNYLERNIPPLVMVLLVIYCVKDVTWGQAPHGLPELIGIGLVAVFHVWLNNALLSIVSGTIVYMMALRIM